MPAATEPFSAVPILLGERWARLLCLALLAGLGLLTGARWLGTSRSHETVVQQPVGPADFSADRSAVTAPDPGDDL